MSHRKTLRKKFASSLSDAALGADPWRGVWREGGPPGYFFLEDFVGGFTEYGNPIRMGLFKNYLCLEILYGIYCMLLLWDSLLELWELWELVFFD